MSGPGLGSLASSFHGGLDTREPAALFAAGSLIQGWSGYQPGTPRLQACKPQTHLWQGLFSALGSRMPGVLYLNFSTVGVRGGSLRSAVLRPNTQDPAGPALQASPGSGRGWFGGSGGWGVGGEGQLRGRRLSMYFPASGPSFARSAGAGSRGRAARPSPAAVPQGRPRPAPHPAAHAQPCSACISSPASARGCLRTGGHAWVVCTLCSCGSLKLCVVNELREGHSGVVDARAPTSALARVWPEALRDAGPRYVI